MEQAGYILKDEQDLRTMADKIADLEKRLKEVKEKFDALKKAGIDEELLIVYLQHKTKLPRKKIKQMIDETEEFFDKLISKEVAEKL